MSPCPRMSATLGRLTNVFRIWVGSLATQTRSMSPMVSSQRRMLPPGWRRRMEGQACVRAASRRSQTGWARAMGMREVLERWNWIWRAMFSAVFLPNRGRAARRPSWAAISSWATVVMSSSCQRRLTVLGPSPGISRTSRMPSGNSALSRS